MRLLEGERRLIQDAIATAEMGSVLEFVCVLAPRASTYDYFPLAWSAVVSLAVPWPLMLLTDLSVSHLLLVQLLSFAIALLVLSLSPVRGRLVPRRVQRRAAYRAAVEQFFIRGLARTPDRCGVLLYVAEEERYARVLVDEGAEKLIDTAVWQGAVERLVVGARSARVGDGFVEALRHCGEHAARVAPRREPSVNVLPDRIVVLD